MSFVYDNFIQINNIFPIYISNHEIAWHLKDANAVLNWLNNNNKILLGGDIIDLNKNYTYDNWYYNYDNSLSFVDNVNNSIDKARSYISDYINKNGDCYYVVLVLR